MRTEATLPTSDIRFVRLSELVEHLTMLMLCATLASPPMLVPAVQTTELLSLLALMTLVMWNLALEALTTLSEMWLLPARRLTEEPDEALPVSVPLDVWQLTATVELTSRLTVLVTLCLISIPLLAGYELLII